MNFYLSRPAVCSALGSGMTAHVNALLAPPKQSPLTFSDAWIKGKNLAFGAINEPLREFSGRLKPPHHSRNNQLLWHTLAQIEPQIEAAKSRYGANRIGVVIGTSTSGVDENIPMFQQFIAKNNWQNIP